jgi:guanylate kinase
MAQQNFILILSSPSGAGKTSLAKQLILEDPRFVPSVSATTRAKRPLEVDKKDYYFVTPEKFKEMQDRDELLESVKVFDHYYGSPRQHIIDKMSEGHDVLFDIDWQGAQILKEKLGPMVVSIFILPPSMTELERRLRARGQDSEEVVQRRMEQAASEISHYDVYDYVLINNEFDKTLARINSIIAAERLRHFDFSKFVKNIMS